MEGQGRAGRSRRAAACRPIPPRTRRRKGKIELQLEALDDKMPAPLASIYSVTDEPEKASPIQILFHGDYLNPTATE